MYDNKLCRFGILKGTLENGKVFDSSVEREQPLTFTLGTGQVILCCLIKHILFNETNLTFSGFYRSSKAGTKDYWECVKVSSILNQ